MPCACRRRSATVEDARQILFKAAFFLTGWRYIHQLSIEHLLDLLFFNPPCSIMADDQASGLTNWDGKDDLFISWRPRDDEDEINSATTFEDGFLRLSEIEPLPNIIDNDDQQRSRADVAALEAKERGPLISPDWPDIFGPGGRYELGRDCYGEGVRPPVTFMHLAARLTK